jgi:hypothetical protein
MSANFEALSSNAGCDSNWIVMNVTKGMDLEDSAMGTGLEDFISQFKDDQVQYGCFKVLGVDNRETVVASRPKYVQVSWCGSSIGGMAKMKALQSKQKAARIFTGMAATIDASEADDLTPKAIANVLLKCGGAHKPTHYDFGAGVSISLDDL